jgi:ABC-type uncharacterized transport system ATPase component
LQQLQVIQVSNIPVQAALQQSDIMVKDRQTATLDPEVYFSSPLRNENNKIKPLEPG